MSTECPTARSFPASAGRPLRLRFREGTARAFVFTGLALPAPAALASVDPPAVLQELKRHGTKESAIYSLPAGEKHKGDMYKGAGTITIAGEQDGDLFAFAQAVTVTGAVTGDVVAMARTVSLDGTVGDSVRVWCDTLSVTGTIKGDLLAFCATVTVADGAHITGDLKAAGAQIVMGGKVDGDLSATGGEVSLSGKVGGDARLKGDIVSIAPTARIGGELDYTSRNTLDLEGKGIVAGSVNHKEKKARATFTTHRFLMWFFFMATSLVVGLAALALTRNVSQAIVATLGGEALRSAGVGFIAIVVLPVALVLSCILIITIPLVIIAFMLLALAVYLAKAPVAILMGRRILKAMGRMDSNAFQALAVGTPALYLLFAIPYVGTLLWFACLFAGIGAMALGIWGHVQARRNGAAAGAPPLAPQPAA